MTSKAYDRDGLIDDLARVAAGDADAMQAVYERTAPKLFGIVLALTRNRDAAEEVLQDVYVRAWHGAGRFDPGVASPITWLATLARRAAIDWVRAERRRTRIQQRLSDEPVTDGTDAVVGFEEHVRIMDCFRQLEPHQARCIRGAFYDGYSYPQLAEAEAVPLGTVKSWIRRGLLRLRECLDDGE